MTKTTPKTNPTYKKWQTRLADTTPWEKKEMDSFISFAFRGSTGSLTPQQRAELQTFFYNALDNNSDTNGLPLSQTYQQQGYQWLMGLWKTKTGKESINNPFGSRETNILENFSHITITDMYNHPPYFNHYSPKYTVVSTTGESFDYVQDRREAPKTGCYIVG